MTTFLKLPQGDQYVYVNVDAIASFNGSSSGDSEASPWSVITLLGVVGKVYPERLTVDVGPEEIARHLGVQLLRYAPHRKGATQCEP